MPKGITGVILDAMYTRTGTIVLMVLCIGLVIGLVLTQQHASRQKSEAEAAIGNYSNKWVETSASLDQQRQVNTSLEGDLKKQRQSYEDLTNAYTLLSSNLDQTTSTLNSTRDTLARRDSRITELESQNQALDQRALDLSTAITNLTAQIDDTRMKLAASEGDKAFLEKELQRLIAEKAELERQFNDLTVLRAQVAKLKEELDISRRLEWIRQGLFARAEERGAQQLMKRTPPAPSTKPTYDLNVEVSADGTVKVLGPSAGVTAAPTETNAPAP